MYQGRIVFNKIFCFSVVLLTLWAAPVLGADLLVPSQYPTIQKGIDAALPGDVVIVADGTYPGNLLVQKAVTIRSENGKENCTIDCGGISRAFTFSGEGTSGAVLSGFTITGGNADVSDDNQGYGGAILCLANSSVVIDDCVFTQNAATFGGAIACVQSSPTISHCVVENNTATLGGGLLCSNLNPSDPSPTIISSKIANNTASSRGGGVYLNRYSSPNLYNCVIMNNSAASNGGAITCYNRSSPDITHCTISYNSVSGESTSYGGGALYGYYFSSPVITNSILWGNQAGNGAEILLSNNSSAQITYSDVNGGGEESSNVSLINSTITLDDTNIEVDPAFAGDDDYHLSPDSPCVDAGNDASALQRAAILAQETDPFDYDIDGDPRVVGDASDMGADEFAPEEDDVLQVEIDIKPDKDINLKSWGLLLVAVKSTNDFDAATIDPGTVLFAEAKPLLKMLIDVDRNRKKDMLFLFWIPQLDLDEDSTEATLTGQTKDKKAFEGTDTVTILKPKVKEKGEKKSKEKDKEKGCSSKKK